MTAVPSLYLTQPIGSARFPDHRTQGFSKNLAMPKTQWSGFIKDYDGAHLMECYIHPTLNYLDVRYPPSPY